jgi:Cu2+-exporting ATPase
MSELIPETPLPPLMALTATQAAALDDAQALNQHTRWLDGPQGERLGESRLLLSGLHCAACAGVIEDAVRALPGVRSCEVSAAAQRATVQWDAGRTTLSAVVAATRAVGYGAFPDTGAEAVALATRETRSALWRLFVAGFCMMQVMMYAAPAYVVGPGEMTADMVQLLRWASWVLSLPVLVFSTGPYFQGAWRALRARRIGMDVPVSLGIAVAFMASSAATFNPQGAFGHEVYFDSLTMFVAFLLVARLLETRARRRAAQSLDALMRQLPDAVERLDAQGMAELVGVSQLRLGDHLRVQVGQAFAADGRVLSGRTEVDESVLTGESRPVPRSEGDAVHAASLNLGAPVVMVVEQLGAATQYQRIVSLVERALTERPALVRAVDRWAGPCLWAVLALALGAWGVWQFIDPQRALWVAVAVLIVTCPCALSLGAPVALLAAAGELARRGVLVQRLDAIEALTHSTDFVFDKTGTLTEDKLHLAACVGLQPAWHPADAAAAASLAAHSRHPLAQALAQQALGQGGAAPVWTDVQEQAGQGLQASRVDPQHGLVLARLGSADWCGGVPDGSAPVLRPAVWWAQARADQVPLQWQVLARFEFDETLRPDAAWTLQALARQGQVLHLLSGDQAPSVQALAHTLGLADARARCTPQDKLDAVLALQAAGGKVTMVGDGINDAPVLAAADVSVALGSAAALAQARADLIVMGNRLSELPRVLEDARRTLRIVRQNLWWALGYNVCSVPLALAGWMPPWVAGLGMAGSSLLVVLNALRLTRVRDTVSVSSAPRRAWA